MQRGFNFRQDGFPCAGGEFRTLSTKLSTGCVDKSKNHSVYRDLGNKPRYQVRYLLRCMIVFHDNELRRDNGGRSLHLGMLA